MGAWAQASGHDAPRRILSHAQRQSSAMSSSVTYWLTLEIGVAAAGGLR